MKGHSGSLVVDADTSEAYGYVVALDIFGKAQVVPLYSAFEQIRNLTSAKISCWQSLCRLMLTKIALRQLQKKLAGPQFVFDQAKKTRNGLGGMQSR